MENTVLPVYGIFRGSEPAESAAKALRDKGFRVDLALIAESNPAVFPVRSAEMNYQLLKSVAAEPVGLLVGASLGIVFGLLVMNALVGIMVTLVFAFAGAMAGLWVADRPPERYRRYVNEGGVMLTVRCEGEEQASVIGMLNNAHAVEVEATDAWE